MSKIQVQNFIPLQRIFEYLDSLKPRNNIPATLEDAWQKKIEFLDEVSMQNNVVIFLWNAYTNHFLYMSDKLKVLSGLEPSLYMAENGIEFSLSRIHPGQIDAGIAIHNQGIKFFVENDIPDYKSVSVFLNYLYKNGNDEYVQVLQNTCPG